MCFRVEKKTDGIYARAEFYRSTNSTNREQITKNDLEKKAHFVSTLNCETGWHDQNDDELNWVAGFGAFWVMFENIITTIGSEGQLSERA